MSLPSSVRTPVLCLGLLAMSLTACPDDEATSVSASGPKRWVEAKPACPQVDTPDFAKIRSDIDQYAMSACGDVAILSRDPGVERIEVVGADLETALFEVDVRDVDSLSFVGRSRVLTWRVYSDGLWERAYVDLDAAEPEVIRVEGADYSWESTATDAKGRPIGWWGCGERDAANGLYFSLFGGEETVVPEVDCGSVVQGEGRLVYRRLDDSTVVQRGLSPDAEERVLTTVDHDWIVDGDTRTRRSFVASPDARMLLTVEEKQDQLCEGEVCVWAHQWIPAQAIEVATGSRLGQVYAGLTDVTFMGHKTDTLILSRPGWLAWWHGGEATEFDEDPPQMIHVAPDGWVWAWRGEAELVRVDPTSGAIDPIGEMNQRWLLHGGGIWLAYRKTGEVGENGIEEAVPVLVHEDGTLVDLQLDVAPSEECPTCGVSIQNLRGGPDGVLLLAWTHEQHLRRCDADTGACSEVDGVPSSEVYGQIMQTDATGLRGAYSMRALWGSETDLYAGTLRE